MSTCTLNRAVCAMSVLDDFSILVLCSHFQVFLFLHVAVRSHRTQVAAIHCQQHHGGRKSTVSDVRQAFSCQHDDDGNPEKESRESRI